MYRPVKHVPITYEEYCQNVEELKKQQARLKKVEKRFDKFKKLLKSINDRVGLDPSAYFGEDDDELLFAE